MRYADPDRVLAALGELDYPANKDRIIACAGLNGADEVVLSALRTLPVETYHNGVEVLRSLKLSPARERTASAKARDARTHRRPRMAEHPLD